MDACLLQAAKFQLFDGRQRLCRFVLIEKNLEADLMSLLNQFPENFVDDDIDGGHAGAVILLDWNAAAEDEKLHET